MRSIRITKYKFSTLIYRLSSIWLMRVPSSDPRYNSLYYICTRIDNMVITYHSGDRTLQRHDLSKREFLSLVHRERPFNSHHKLVDAYDSLEDSLHNLLNSKQY